MTQTITKEDIEHVKSELWHRNEPFFVLHDKQVEIYNHIFENEKSFLTVINCARQFGKTYLAVFIAFLHCLKKPKTVVKYGSAFYTDLQSFIFPTCERMAELMPETLRPSIVESKKLVEFSNGSRIDFVGLDLKPDGMRGNSVDLAIIEEAGFTKKLRYIYYDVIVPMFTHRQKNNPKCIMLGTPNGDLTQDFTNFFFQKAKAEKTYYHYTIEDNPLLSRVEKDRIIDEYTKDCKTEAELRIQTTKMRRELFGEVTKDVERSIIPEWSKDYAKSAERDEYFQYYKRYVAMDYGVADKTVFLFYYYDFLNDQVVFEGEVQDSGQSMTTDKLYEAVKEMEDSLYGGKIDRRVADTTNLLLINDFQHKYGMTFLKVKKDRLHVMVNEARMWVKQGRVRVDPLNCRELAGCLEHGMWNEKKTDFERSDIYGHYDALAAFVYSLRIVDTRNNPIPVTHKFEGIPKQDIVVVNDQKNDLRKKFKKIFYNEEI